MSYKSNIQNLQISSSGQVTGVSTVETTNLGATGAVVGNLSTTLDTSAALEVDSTSKGFLLPRLTTAQRNSIASPSEGLVVYNTDTDNLNFYSGSSWKEATIDPTSNGLVVRTASGVATSRSVTAGTGISVANGDGVSGNPTVTNTGVTSLQQIGGMSAGSIGSYAFAVYFNGDYNSFLFNPGSTFAGNQLAYACITNNGGVSLTIAPFPAIPMLGNWRLMGNLESGEATQPTFAVSLFLRYA